MKINFKSGLKYIKDKMSKKIVVLTFFCFTLLILLCSFSWYILSIKPVSKNSIEVSLLIDIGSSTTKISQMLKDNDIIKSPLAFKIYVKLNNLSDFKAGDYIFNKNMSIQEITSLLGTGYLPSEDNFNLTFIEGKNIRHFAKKIADNTNNSEEDVFNLLQNEEYIDSLIEKYWFLDEIIKDPSIYYPLEGYLFPDTYNFNNKDVSVEEIFTTLLNQTDKKLSKYKNDILESEFSIHELVTLASIIESESNNLIDKENVASVFLNRLNRKMALGSCVTTYYAIKVDFNERDLYMDEINLENPYNTRGPGMEGKLPIGPISSFGESSFVAVLFPRTTNYLYFVSDKTKKLYFNETFEMHQETVKDLKEQGLWYEY